MSNKELMKSCLRAGRRARKEGRSAVDAVMSVEILQNQRLPLDMWMRVTARLESSHA